MKIILDKISQRAAANPFAPALISPLGSIAYDEVTDAIIKVANFFEDRRLPRLGRAYINVGEPELRLVVTLAAFTYGLVPMIASPETISRDYAVDFTIGGRATLRADIAADINVDEVLGGSSLADGKRRNFPDRGEDELALVTETTGTTGYPKLLAISRKVMEASFDDGNRRVFEPGDRVIMAMGGVSRYAVNVGIATLFGGAAQVATPVDPLGLLKMAALFEVTDLLITPVSLSQMVDLMEQQHIRLPALRHLTITGSLTSPGLVQRLEPLTAAEILVTYGTSESARLAMGVVTAKTMRRNYVGDLRPSVTVVRAGTREEPAPVVISNDIPLQTTYIVGGRLVTETATEITLPDLGYLEGRSLFLTGRADEVFNFSGSKLPFDRIQQVVEQIAAPRDVGIVNGGPIGLDNDVIVAVVANVPLDLDDLRKRVTEAIGWAKVADHFHFVQLSAVPRNAMGKIDRRETLRQFADVAKVVTA